MRKLKKAVAVLLTAAMTMSASVMAFADQQVTIHFQNGSNWDTVGAWIYQGISFNTNVTPKDKCAVITKEETGDKIVWPGAKMDDDKATGWKTITATFSDSYTTDGMVMIFNNYVADTTLNDTTTEADLESIKASGIKTTATDTKEQTGNVLLNKKTIANKFGGSVTDLYVTWDGKTAEFSATAPESYTSAIPADNTNNNAGTADNNGSAAGTANGGSTANNAAKGTGTSSNTNAPKTGDTVAVSVVMFGLLAAVAYVASKKKANA